MSRLRSWGRSISRRVRFEGGYTLIELLWVIALMIIVVGVPMTFVIQALNQQNVSSSRTAASAQEEIGMQRLTRDLRQVAPNTTTTFTWGATSGGVTSASVSLTIPVPGTGGASTETVAWSCSFPSGGTGSCTRAVNGGTAVTQITGVSNLTFSPVDTSGNSLGGSSAPYTATNPAFVGIALQVKVISQQDASGTTPVKGISSPITLRDGVDLLNNTL